MKNKTISTYDPNYPYKKEGITTDMSPEGYPIIERTTNALLFPLGPQDDVDFREMK